jgi:hypothetical protein
MATGFIFQLRLDEVQAGTGSRFHFGTLKRGTLTANDAAISKCQVGISGLVNDGHR